MGSDVSPAYLTELKRLLEQYRGALERDPRNPQILVDMGSVLLKLEQTDEAMRALRMAAWVYFNQEQFEEAVATCGRVFRFRPVDSEAKQLVDEVRKGRLLDDRAIEDALRRGRARRVSDGQPVVVLASQIGSRDDVTVPQAEWDQTAERPMPPAVPEPPGQKEARPAAASLNSLRRQLLAGSSGTPPPPPPLLRQTSGPLANAPTMPDGEDPDAGEGEDDLEPRQGDEAPTVPTGQPGTTLDLPIPPGLLARAARQEIQAGRELFAEHDRIDRLLLVERGRLELTRAAVEIEVISSGSVLGALALLGDGRAHLTCRAVDPGCVLVFAGDLLEKVLALPEVSRALRRCYRDRLQQLLLRVSPLFSTLADEDARVLLRKCRPLRATDGQVVLQRGSAPTGLYFVLLGRLEMTEPQPAGGSRVLDQLTDGDHFGDVCLLEDIPAPANVTARGFCQLLQLPAAELFRFVERRPEVGQWLREAVGRKLRQHEAIRAGQAVVRDGRVVWSR